MITPHSMGALKSAKNNYRLLLLTCLWVLSTLAKGQEVPSNITGEKNRSRQQNPSAYIQSKDKRQKKSSPTKPLSMSAAIEQGLRKNFNEQVREFQREQLELNWEDTHIDFWYPNLEMSLRAGPHSVGTLREGSLPGDVASDDPSGQLSLGFEDYTIFDWGKEYLDYLNSQDTYQRDKEILSEEKRDLKHKILKRYLDLLTTQKVENIYRQQLRHASYVYNLNKEKVTSGKLSRREYYQARSEYLRAQNEFAQARNEHRLAEEAMAEILIDPAGTRYNVDQWIDYNPLEMNVSEAQKLSKKKNPDVLTSQKDLRISDRQYDIAKRENLPLPEFSVDLGAYTHQFGPGRGSTRYRTGPNSSNIELVATVNATWTLFGDKGLLNSRDLRDKYLDKLVGQKRVQQARHQADSSIQSLFHRIQFFETQIKILKARTVALQKTFDTALDNYLDDKSSFQDVRQALIEKTQANELKARSHALHLQNKIDLANTIGIEDIPGESFENQVVQGEN